MNRSDHLRKEITLSRHNLLLAYVFLTGLSVDQVATHLFIYFELRSEWYVAVWTATFLVLAVVFGTLSVRERRRVQRGSSALLAG